MDSQFILAVDLGTTNCKVLILDEGLNVIEKVTTEYPITFPRPGWVEQLPEDWWKAVKESIRKAISKHNSKAVASIGLSGQMHGLVLLDDAGEVIRPAILWNDQRSSSQCDQVYSLVGGRAGLLKYTNNPMLPGYTGGKILWVKEHESEYYKRTSAFLLPKDYIRYRLTGIFATDVSDASGTGLYDVQERMWAYDLIEILDIPVNWFPQVYESSKIIGSIETSVAAELGLTPGIPVIAGGGDAVMQTVGGGAVSSDIALIVIGTGGNVTVSVPHFIENPGAVLQVFCHVLADKWIAMGVTLSAGSSLKWFRDTLGGLEIQTAKDLDINAYELLNKEASLSPPGSNGLIFLPYLLGERCPYTDIQARGSFIGIGLDTRKCDLVRSVMEGVTFSLRDVLELITQSGINPSIIHSSGGGSSSPIWRQIQADIFKKEVTTQNNSEDAGALGAGIIAGVAVGLWPSVEKAVSLIKTRTINQPIDENAVKYERIYELYKKLYPALKQTFKGLYLISQ